MEALAGEALEPHRGLAFESDFACKTQKSRSGVEETSDGRCGEGTKVFLHELQSVAITGRK